jgi:diacylglycerol kinase family enzyme
MHETEFAGILAEICTYSLIFPGKTLRRIIIANSKAGGFTIKKRWKSHEKILREALEKARNNPKRTDVSSVILPGVTDENGFVSTERAGHAEVIVRDTLAHAQENAGFYLIIVAGGDGTSREALMALKEASPALLERFVILRLPMGTGNDGADSPHLDRALDLLIKPSVIQKRRALFLETAVAGKGPFPAFNILSVGLDAFVTHMTNKMKGNLPGDSYKLWVDVASLLYDKLYKVRPMNITVYDDHGAVIDTLEKTVLLAAVGESGFRTYGSQKKILPDERNVCIVEQMSLLRKVALKGLFTTGEHTSLPESHLYTAQRIEITGTENILAQMDGEAVELTPADFPCTIALTEPFIPVLQPAVQ